VANADRIIELLHEAKARPAGAERERFLAEACGDDAALKEQIVSLLEAAREEGESDFLRNIPLNRQAIVLTEKPGDRIGRYKLLEQIGEGGCGVVYMAEQQEPVRRRVALKVIKLGMDTKSVIARFEAERQALALMDHPNIAKVLDGGATQTGRLYFVMELVRGVPITEFCDVGRLTIRARLQLFVQICQAIQHAHQKGIIHRDLKPSNILVTVNDGAPVPKVIDFGIAKATGQTLTDKTVFTQFHAFLGTPAYISPEQAEMSSGDVDTRSDIYSLGVLLYELLTGCTPFDGEELLRSGLDEMRRVIRNDEPLRPSTRLDTLRLAEATVLSGKRQVTVPELAGDARGDLDCIVMKCLEKDRSRRYETANGLAMDIQRHLNNEPVNARSPSGPYRLQKLIQRNKLAFVATAAIVLALLIGAVVSTSQAIRATRAEREQMGLRRQAETGNRDLRDTVSLLELQRAEDLFRVNDAPVGVAHLAAMLRRDPSNHIAASRLVSALVDRNWALPAAPPMRHRDRVMTASFSPDGLHVLSASWDKTAQTWDVATGQLLTTVRHDDQIFSARYTRSHSRFVTASADGTARIWSATNGTPLTPPLRHKAQVYWAEFSPNEQSVVTASADKTARIWDSRSGELRQELRNHDTGVLLARFSPDGRRIVTGTESGAIRIWRADTGEALFSLEGHRGRINALAFRPDGNAVASASDDQTARLWNATDGQPVCAPLRHNNHVTHAVFSPDGRVVLTTSKDGAARLWNTTNGFPEGQPLRHEGDVVFGAFSPDGEMVVTASNDNSARLWSVRSGMPFCQPLRQYERVTHAEFDPAGVRLVTAAYDQTVQVWNIQPRRFLGIGIRHEKHVMMVAFDPRQDSVLCASVDQTARLWNARTGQQLGQPMHHQGAVRSAEFSADGWRIVTASEDGTASVWDSSTGQVIAGPLQHAKTVWSAQFSPDGERVVTASEDGTARLWDARTGKPLTAPLEHGAIVRVARFSPDGRWVVTASENWSARVWDAQTGQPVTDRLPHLDWVEWAEFSPDSQRVVSASRDNTARIWDVRTGKPIGSPLQHTHTVTKAVFSPDGRRVATASVDRTARVWDTSTGRALTNPLTHDGTVSQVCFSPDGRRLLTSCWSDASRLWDANTGRPLTEWLGLGSISCFDSTGRRIVSGAYSGTVCVWDAPPVPTPVPLWFMALAEAVAGTRLSALGNAELVSRGELDEVARRLASVSEGDFYERLGRWFLADPTQRPVSPFESLQQGISKIAPAAKQ